ncbi:hypothetical protein PPYR_12031 [Photinus pyralis]|uniref:Immunoglobulin-binding protein 1 n=1 Tax=Photinus pyralis TaxID=7054 RepID=A0A1Y1MB56_PHOPY|nr:immunoglobulin-binding protein 1-like [Photinus pyralis]XP_031351537.1 immunoglobulin-binding protein 1-like [Photinus pyralis]KAB0795192.1 hypothetical protein PPYR_12031 [Photinus pyralis]
MASNESSTGNSESDLQTLASMFQEGLDLYNNLGKIDEPTNSPLVQSNIKKAIHIFENATRLVSLAGMFSSNESVDEIATEDLQYMLLPALLGALCLKLTSRDRNDITQVSEVYYKDFLQRCSDYGLHELKQDEPAMKNLSLCDSKVPDADTIKTFVITRAQKIQRFKEQKELKSKLEDLKKNLANADEDSKREYFLTMIKLFIFEAVDELSCIEAEKQILEIRANMVKEDQPKPKRPPPPPLKPVIITRDSVQKAVFGAGYPSLPVMSVQEFYEKRVADGIFPDPSVASEKPFCLQNATPDDIALRDEHEAAEAEKKVEQDDEDELARLRRRDEFKDEHRRGWGNRMNRS